MFLGYWTGPRKGKDLTHRSLTMNFNSVAASVARLDKDEIGFAISSEILHEESTILAVRDLKDGASAVVRCLKTTLTRRPLPNGSQYFTFKQVN